MVMRKVMAAIVGALTMIGVAGAQEVEVFTGGELDFGFPSEGATQELSAYLEAERDGLYGGLRGTVANESANNEIELSFGYRGETEAGFSYDLSYTRFYLPDDGGDCCGEVALEVGQSLGEEFSLVGELAHDPDNSLSRALVGGAFQATEEIELSANYEFIEADGGDREREWDFGATYALNDETNLDLRYYDGSDFEGYFGLNLSFDTTLLGE